MRKIKYLIMPIIVLSFLACGKNATEYFDSGFQKQRLGDNKGLLKTYTKAIEKNPQYLEAYHFRGLLKALLGDHNSAIQDYDKVIELNPNVTNIYFSRGHAKANTW